MGGDGLLDAVVLRELHPAPVDEAGARHPRPAGGADGEGGDRDGKLRERHGRHQKGREGGEWESEGDGKGGDRDG